MAKDNLHLKNTVTILGVGGVTTNNSEEVIYFPSLNKLYLLLTHW